MVKKLKHILANIFLYILTVAVYVDGSKSVTEVSSLCLEQSASVHYPLSLHPSPMSLVSYLTELMKTKHCHDIRLIGLSPSHN